MQTDMYTVINPETGMIICVDTYSGGCLAECKRIVLSGGYSIFSLEHAKKIQSDLIHNRVSYIKDSGNFIVAKIVFEPLKEI